ncbi:MAG: hypothetical protein HYU86_07250 [Chloroflexi bacterium]|nr:hypothetical protein [Chloroflexota bacterium]
MDQLGKFVVSFCRCTIEDISWVQAVKLQNDGLTDYNGYWHVTYDDPAILGSRNIKVIIVLNTFFLLTLEQMEETLAHEYGHHWTLGHLISRMGRCPDEYPPRIYNSIRGLDGRFAPRASQWEFRHSEVLAEDYKHHFTPFRGTHRMVDLIGFPSSEVKDYIASMGHRRHL